MVLMHISPDWISVAESQGSPIDTLRLIHRDV